MGHATWVDEELSGRRTDPGAGAVRDELLAGERVIWEGRPRLGWLFVQALPAAAVGAALALISWVSLMETRGEAAIVAFPALLIGLGMMGLPAWYALRGLGTRYVITDRRAITLEPLLIPGVAIRSYPPSALSGLVRHQRGDGSGDLIFDGPRRLRGRDARIARRGFLAISDARRVELLLREALLRPRSAR